MVNSACNLLKNAILYHIKSHNDENMLFTNTAYHLPDFQKIIRFIT